MNNQPCLPQEIIDYIIMRFADADTIKKTRSYLSEYAYKQTMKLNIKDVLHDDDLVNFMYLQHHNLLNRAVIYELCFLYASYDNLTLYLDLLRIYGYKLNTFTFKFIFIAIDDKKIPMILDWLYKTRFYFTQMHYQIATEVESKYLVMFLLRIGVPIDHTVIYKACIDSKFKFVKFLLKHNIGNTLELFDFMLENQLLEMIVYTMEYIPIIITAQKMFYYIDHVERYDLIFILRMLMLFKKNWLCYQEAKYLLQKL